MEYVRAIVTLFEKGHDIENIYMSDSVGCTHKPNHSDKGTRLANLSFPGTKTISHTLEKPNKKSSWIFKYETKHEIRTPEYQKKEPVKIPGGGPKVLSETPPWNSVGYKDQLSGEQRGVCLHHGSPGDSYTQWDPNVEWVFNAELNDFEQVEFKAYKSGQKTRRAIKDVFASASEAPCVNRWTRYRHENYQIIEDIS